MVIVFREKSVLEVTVNCLSSQFAHVDLTTRGPNDPESGGACREGCSLCCALLYILLAEPHNRAAAPAIKDPTGALIVL